MMVTPRGTARFVGPSWFYHGVPPRLAATSLTDLEKTRMTHSTRIIHTVAASATLLCVTAAVADAQTHTTSQPATPRATPAPATHPVLQAYYGVKNALVSDDSTHAQAGGATLLAALNDIDTTSLAAPDRVALGRLKTNATQISGTTALAHQRQHFVALSQDMVTVTKDAKLGKGYVQFCPMANSGKGAIWLSETKPIKNPYLGRSMPGCGSVKDTL